MEKKRQLIRYGIFFLMLIPLMLFRDATPNNELRYLSIADEAIRNGNIFAFFNHGFAYADKPPLYLWLIIISKLIFGKHIIFVLSLFSVIPAFVTVSVFSKWCSAELTEKQRMAADLALLSAVYFIASGIVIRMDMMMTMFITLSLYSFYKMYCGDGRTRWKILFPLFTFLALFTKGPVGVLVPLVCVPVFLLFQKKIKTIGRYWGWISWAILAGLCAIWFAGVFIDGGKEYLNNLVFHQTIDRAVNSFHHKEPFYYYGISIWYILYPWSLFSIGIIITALCSKQKMSQLARFFICTGLTVFVMMSCISSKIDIYILPSLGFFIFGAFLLEKENKYQTFIDITLYIPVILFILILPGIAIAEHFVTVPYRNIIHLWMLIPLLLLNLYALVALIGKKRENAIIAVAASLYITIFIVGFSVKKLNPEIGYGDICEKAMVEAQKNNIDRFVMATNDDGRAIMKRGENIDVYLGQETEMIPESKINADVEGVIGDSNGIVVFSRKDKKPVFSLYKHND